MLSNNYSQGEIDEIVKKYELNEQELNETVDLIFDILSRGARAHKNPLAVVVGGQSGGGKTGIIGYVQKCLNDDDVIIDNDTYREFHPMVKEINEKYPELFTECTDQLSFYATPIIIDRMMKAKYNLIIHQTLKSKRIADDAMQKLRDSGYIVGVVALAVANIESYLSMMERCLVQLKLDKTCRWVDPSNHDKAYNAIPETLNYIENEIKNYHFIQVVMRGINDPTNPRVIYNKRNENNLPRENKKINRFFAKEDVQDANAVDALSRGRTISEKETLDGVDSRLKEAVADDKQVCGNENSEAKERIEKLKEMVKNLREE